MVHEWRPHEESNLDLRFRKPLFYPLNYGGPITTYGIGLLKSNNKMLFVCGRSGLGSSNRVKPTPDVKSPFLPISSLLNPSNRTLTLSRSSEKELIDISSPSIINDFRVNEVSAAFNFAGSCQDGSTVLGSRWASWFCSDKITSQKSLTPSPS